MPDRLISADALLKEAMQEGAYGYVDAEQIKNAPTVDAEPVRHGRWIKMSDADGAYYACSECGNELPRVINSFDPQFDLFPKLKCIDKTTYCPNCGAKMDEVEDE